MRKPTHNPSIFDFGTLPGTLQTSLRKFANLHVMLRFRRRPAHHQKAPKSVHTVGIRRFTYIIVKKRFHLDNLLTCI